MMHVRAVKVALGLLVLLGGGCDFTRPLDINDKDHESKLVLQGQMQPQRPLQIRVSRSVGAFEPGEVEDDAFSVTDATITIFQDDRRLGTLSRDTLNLYSTEDVSFSAGPSYTVRASAPGLDPVEATDRIPVLPPIRFASVERDDDDRTLELTIEDPGSTANYYRIALWAVTRNEEGNRFRTTAEFRTEAQAIVLATGSEATGSYSGRDAIFPDDLFDGTTYRIDLRVDEEDERRAGYVLVVEGLSEDAYRYRRLDERAEETGDNPFAEPVDLEGNVEGGFGLVGGRSVDTLQYRVDPQSQ